MNRCGYTAEDCTATRKFLQRLGHAVLKRSNGWFITICSATKLNRQELCYRYGWKFSSDMPDIYISRAGMESKALDEKFTQTELGTVKENLAQMQQAGKMKDDRIRQLEHTTLRLQQDLHALSKMLDLNPTARELETIIRWKRERSNS